MTDNIIKGRNDLNRWEDSKPSNFFTAHGLLQRILERYLSTKYSKEYSLLVRTGSITATEMNELVRVCNLDQNLPDIDLYDGMGNQIQEVVFHPAQHRVNQIAWGTGLLSKLSEPGNEVLSGAYTYLLSHNGEAGTVCPLACTAGAIKLIQTLGSPEQKERLLPALTEPDFDKSLVASQFLTEVQGGSDVGSNATMATPDPDRPGWFLLNGEKWFCSVANADLFLMTARLEGAQAGTRGLGLFLMSRVSEGKPNGFSIRRLKTKLGTRSLPSAEIDFKNSLAEPVGPLKRAFANVVGIVLDTSRLFNSVAACGLMRRACIEAQTFAEHRVAFGVPIIELPPIQSILAKMKVLTEASVISTFRILNMTDNVSLGRKTGLDQEVLKAARRTFVSLSKYRTAVRSSEVVRDAIEVLGGNGTIEEFSILPRLYRDAMVIESWEGTHNVLCAQILRDFTRYKFHKPWLSEIDLLINGLSRPELKAHINRAGDLLEETRQRLSTLLSVDQTQASYLIRSAVDSMCLVHTYASLLDHVNWELESGKGTQGIDLVEYYGNIIVDNKDPFNDIQQQQLIKNIAFSL